MAGEGKSSAALPHSPGAGRTRLATSLALLLTGPPVMAAPSGPPSQTLQACAQAVNAGHAPRSAAQALSKGVNVTTLFDDDVPAGRDLGDISRLEAIGFSHIRIPIDPVWVLSWPSSGVPDEKLRHLDEAICTALSNGLAVIVDNHDGSLQPKDGSDDAILPRLAAAWDRLAARYAIFTPDLMFFEALNEPAFTDSRRWEPWQRELLAHIRAVAPRHTVLLTASPDSTPWALSALTPVADSNVVYVFHFYSPMIFTMQGADWADPALGSVRGLEYPPDARNLAQVRSLAAPSLRDSLASYPVDYAGARAIVSEIDVAAAWARTNHSRLIADEIGVYAAVPAESRAAWFRDVTRTLEARSIGWTVWEWRGGFGVASDLEIKCGEAASMRFALGLCPDRRAPNKPSH